MLSRSADGALLLGRLLVAALFLPSGFNHLMGFSGFATFLDLKGIPYPEIVAGMLVAAEFLGPIALIVGLWPRVTALALIGFAAATLWLTHGPSALRLIMRPGQNGSSSSSWPSWAGCCSTLPAGLEHGAARACGRGRVNRGV
jgi:putative oxidoreductase